MVPLTRTLVSRTTRWVLGTNLAKSLLNIHIDFCLGDVFVGRPDFFEGVRKFSIDFVAIQFSVERLPDLDLVLFWQLLDRDKECVSPIVYLP
jgi:hypothetical protein